MLASVKVAYTSHPPFGGFDIVTLHMATRQSLAELKQRCAAHGVSSSPIQPRADNEAIIDVPDPDGTVLRFYWVGDTDQPDLPAPRVVSRRAELGPDEGLISRVQRQRISRMARDEAPLLQRRTTPLVVAAAAFVAAGGFIHLREWLDTYRDVPASVPGAAVVRVGFPINAGLSLLLAVALIVSMGTLRRFAPVVVAAAAIFEAGALGTLILSRTSTVAGWMEPVWTKGANQTRAVEIGAIGALAAVIAIVGMRRRSFPVA